MSRMTRALGLLVVPVAVVTMLPGTAQAVAPFGPAHQVLPDSCAGSLTVLDSSGGRHGFTLCRLSSGYDDLYAVTAAPGASTWKRTRVATKAQSLMAVADDGHSSYALYDSTTGVELLTRTRSGTNHVKTLVAKRDGAAGTGALVARGGKWWAVWSDETAITGGTECFYLFQAKTLDGIQGAHNTKLCASEPSLALGSNGEPVLTYRVSQDEVGGQVVVSKWRAGKWSKPHVVTAKNQVGKLPTVSVSGTTTRVTWLQFVPGKNHYVVEVATEVGSGAWHTRSFAPPAVFDTAVVSHQQTVESKGKVVVAWTVLSTKGKEIIEVEENTGGKWSQREVGDGTSGDAVLTQLAAIKGRAYLVMEHSDTTIYDLAAHQ